MQNFFVLEKKLKKGRTHTSELSNNGTSYTAVRTRYYEVSF